MDESHLVQRFSTLIEAAGFTSVACVRWSASGVLSSDRVLVNTRPQIWLDEYTAANFMAVDPVLSEVAVALQPFAWSDVARRRKLDAREERVLQHAAAHGMHDGFVVPVFGVGGNTSLVNLAGRECDLSEVTRASLTAASLYFVNQLAALRHRHERTSVKLSRREIEIMRWIAAGKSDWQVGQILEISAKTVNYHVERVKRKLGVASRTQAVIAALGRPPAKL